MRTLGREHSHQGGGKHAKLHSELLQARIILKKKKNQRRQEHGYFERASLSNEKGYEPSRILHTKPFKYEELELIPFWHSELKASHVVFWRRPVAHLFRTGTFWSGEPIAYDGGWMFDACENRYICDMRYRFTNNKSNNNSNKRYRF